MREAIRHAGFLPKQNADIVHIAENHLNSPFGDAFFMGFVVAAEATCVPAVDGPDFRSYSIACTKQIL